MSFRPTNLNVIQNVTITFRSHFLNIMCTHYEIVISFNTLMFRQSTFNPLDFSVILGYIIPNTNQVFRLRRYNGKSHEHTNWLEQEKFYDFHIHTATERYQIAGWNEDGYATPTDRYSDHHGALRRRLMGFFRARNFHGTIGIPA